MFQERIESAALQWAAAARESAKSADWAAQEIQGTTTLASSARLWAEYAELHARRSVSSTGSQSAAEAVSAAEAAAYVAANAAKALIADAEPGRQTSAYSNIVVAKLTTAAKGIFSILEEMAEPAAKDGWCEVFSLLDNVEDEIRRELVERSRHARAVLARFEATRETVPEIWDAAVAELLAAAEAKEEWMIAMKEAEVLEEADAPAVIATAEKMANAARSLSEKWAEPAWHLFLKIKDGASIATATAATVAVAGCLGAAIAACNGALTTQVYVAGHTARRRILRWMAAEAKAKRKEKKNDETIARNR